MANPAPASSTTGIRTWMGAWQCAQRPRSRIQLTTGMLWRAFTTVRQAGQCDRGTARLNREAGGGSILSVSNACIRHWRWSMTGRRSITTFRKLPTHSPASATRTVAVQGGVRKRSMVSDLWAGAGIVAAPRWFGDHWPSAAECRAELENRQVHGNDEAPDDDSEDAHQQGLDQCR